VSPEEKTLPARAAQLIEMLSDGDAHHRQTAAEELASIAIRDVRIQLALEKAAEDDPERLVRLAAHEALVMLDYRMGTAEQRATVVRERFGATGDSASVVKPLPPKVQKLLERLKSPDAYQRQVAAEELSALGFKDPRVRVSLEELEASDPEKAVRLAALEALVMLDYRQPKARH
jgi:HEAT repeat protein